ncbi:unnamed protein product [Ophioblennius macclurei]
MFTSERGTASRDWTGRAGENKTEKEKDLPWARNL